MNGEITATEASTEWDEMFKSAPNDTDELMCLLGHTVALNSWIQRDDRAMISHEVESIRNFEYQGG